VLPLVANLIARVWSTHVSSIHMYMHLCICVKSLELRVLPLVTALFFKGLQIYSAYIHTYKDTCGLKIHVAMYTYIFIHTYTHTSAYPYTNVQRSRNIQTMYVHTHMYIQREFCVYIVLYMQRVFCIYRECSEVSVLPVFVFIVLFHSIVLLIMSSDTHTHTHTHTHTLSLSPSHTHTHTQVGVVEDNDNRKDIGEFVCFQSTADATKLTTIGQYIERMKEGQTCVYFVSGEGRAQVCTE